MKRFLRIFGIALILLAAVSVLFACEKGEQAVTVKSIEVIEAPTEPYYVGDPHIVLSDVILLVTYSNKETKRVALDDTMIADGADKLKFTQEGTWTVAVTYEGGVGYYQFEVKKITKQNTYLASFYSLGGTEVRSIAANVLTALSVPEREGYAFDGWYTDIDCSGERVVEPYTLTANTLFYAKWLDERICTVTFYDWDDSVVYEVDIHYGEKLNLDDYAYPAERVTAGRRFQNWTVINGDVDEVTENLIVNSYFEIDNCIVKVVRMRSKEDPEVVEVPTTRKYDDTFMVDLDLLPKQEGSVSRYVVYHNHDEDYENTKNNYTELPEGGVLVLKEPYTTIMPLYEPLTYEITIYNGVDETKLDERGNPVQKDEYKKNGNIALERVYENEAALKNFTVEWNRGFDFDDYKQDPYLATPTKITGYKSEWCYVRTKKDNTEVWYNKNGQIWNKEKQIFEDPEYAEGETASEWTLTDAEDEYVAKVYQGVLTKIKGNVIVRALYTKEVYTVKLVRYASNGVGTELATFQVKYRTDFDLYDNASYPNAPDSTQTFPERDVLGYSITNEDLRRKALSSAAYDPQVCDVEKLYLYENTDLAVKTFAVNGGYYTTGDVASESVTEEDWTVKWYSSANLTTDDVTLYFGGKPVYDAYGDVVEVLPFTYEVTGNTTLYCRDSDNRKYWVYFSYGYDYATHTYSHPSESPIVGQRYVNGVLRPVYQELFRENEVVTPPITTEQISCEVNGVTVPYVFLGWYDMPYSAYLLTGNRGNRLTNFATRTSAVHYYAHYECNTTFSVKIYDKTQSTAFIGKAGYENYLVADNSISYEMPIASVFDMSMIFKGTSDGSGTTVSGQKYYDKSKQNAFYDTYYLGAGGINDYLTAFYAADTKTTLGTLLTVFEAMRDDYLAVLTQVYDHTYAYETAEYEYYLNAFNDTLWTGDDSGDVFDFATLRSYLERNGCDVNVLQRMDDAGYEGGTFFTFGGWNDWIRVYGERLAELYAAGYEDKHTGLIGISHGNSALVTDEMLAEYSFYQKIVLMIGILREYIDFLTECEGYAYNAVSPQYATSSHDLNVAYGYNGVSEIKYSFSGWYLTPTYTVSYSPSFDLHFIVDEDYSLYAKWLDVTKGTEGLVYEEVTYAGGTGYVLIDFTNKAQYEAKGYGESEFYYVTTDDTGTVPEKVVRDNERTELQLPSGIDKYLDKTAEAAAEANWATAYADYLVFKNGTYVQALATFDNTIKYYKMETYPVIGIKSGAVENYASSVYMVTLPLNLYFLEEGAFKNCDVVLYSRMKAKAGEVAENYVVVSDNGFAVYQQDAFVGFATGKASTSRYGASDVGNTLIAFAVGNDGVTDYRIGSDTDEGGALIPDAFTVEHIGAYAFNYARFLCTVTGAGSLKSIQDYAFKGSTALFYFGTDVTYDVANHGKAVFGSELTTIGKEAFSGCIKITRVQVETNSKLSSIGKDAFVDTTWYQGDAHKGVITLSLHTEDGIDAYFVLGFAAVTTVNVDQGKLYDLDGTENVSGEYFAISTDSTKLIVNASGGVENVILYGNVRMITESAFEGLNAHRYTWYGVRNVARRAFASNPAMSDIYVYGAYDNLSCVLGEEVFYGKGEGSVAVHFGSVALQTVVKDATWNDPALQ